MLETFPIPNVDDVYLRTHELWFSTIKHMTAIVFCDVQHFSMSWSDKTSLDEKISVFFCPKSFYAKENVWPAQICSSPHCTIWFFSDAQLPDTLRVVFTNLARASQFWTFWYRILDGPSGGRDISGGQTPERTTRQTASVDGRTTPYNLPTTVDRNRGKTNNTLSFRPICAGSTDWELIS